MQDTLRDTGCDSWIWDCETYPNVFTLCAVYANGAGIRVFEISDRKNDIDEMVAFLRKVKQHSHRLVGFNSIGFDYPVLHEILVNYKRGYKMSADEIYQYAMKVIDSNRGDGFGIKVKQSEVLIPQLDLYRMHHFDNPAKATSLKMLEFNMRSDNIEDLPFPVGTVLTSEQMDTLIEYNKHDVRQTLKFYYHSLEAIRLRETLTKKFGFDCTNMSDAKIGSELFISKLEKAIPGCCYKKTQYGRKMNQTVRDKIVLKDLIFPYIKFNRPEFQAVLDWFKTQTITETKGVFSDILECNLGDVAKYAEMVTKRKKFASQPSIVDVSKLKAENPLMWVEEVDLKSKKGAKSYWACHNVAETLNVVVDGFRFDYGTGGIHGALQNTIVEEGNGYIIESFDVASMYPNIGIKNRVYPEHLSERFCDIYESLYHERKKYGKGSGENLALKLALNASYGNSNNQYSALYDSAYTMKITINGQLMLSMLADMLLQVPTVQIIMANTDGLEYLVKEEFVEQGREVCKEWESITKLDLERVNYSKMFIANVNNYLAVYTNGKVKNKGAYEYKDLGWNKNFSSLVIPMAAEHELLGKGTAEDFILNHKDKFDFMLRTKVDRSSRLVLVAEDGTETQLQNICRYYPSTKGGKLVKIMPPLKGKEEAGERRLSIDAEWNVVPCNDISEFNWDIDYNYYITEARKLIDPLKKKEVE